MKDIPFKDFNNWFIEVDGTRYIKTIRYSSDGFKVSPQKKHKFLREDGKVSGDMGCFAFLRLVDQFALTGVRSGTDMPHMTYIPDTWEVYARNGLDPEGYKECENPKVFVEGVDKDAFVKVSVLEILERQNDIIEHPSGIHLTGKEQDGASFDLFCNFKGCEIVLDESQSEWINAQSTVYTKPKVTVNWGLDFDDFVLITEWFNETLLPSMLTLKLTAKLSERGGNYFFEFNDRSDLEFRVDSKNNLITFLSIETKSFNRDAPFINLLRDVIPKTRFDLELEIIKFRFSENLEGGGVRKIEETINLSSLLNKNKKDGKVRLVTFQTAEVVEELLRGSYVGDFDKRREKHRYISEVIFTNVDLPIWCFDIYHFSSTRSWYRGSSFVAFKSEMSLLEETFIGKFLMVEVEVDAKVVFEGKTRNSSAMVYCIPKLELSEVVSINEFITDGCMEGFFLMTLYTSTSIKSFFPDHFRTIPVKVYREQKDVFDLDSLPLKNIPSNFIYE